jgi:hypothetical protein
MMHIKSSYIKLSRFKLCPFGPVASMNEKMFLGWKEYRIVLESHFQAWFLEKHVLETLISSLRFFHIYS